MGFFELFLIAVGVSMDAFAVAVCIGLALKKATLRASLTVGLYFGVFQAVMPLIGYMLATRFADKITAFDHWVAFAVLCFIGGSMIVGSSQAEDYSDKGETLLKPKRMLSLAVATSVDSLAVGVSFAFLKVEVVPSVASIGITTLVLSMLGVKAGGMFGAKLRSRAECVGGAILILMGLKILLEHLEILT